MLINDAVYPREAQRQGADVLRLVFNGPVKSISWGAGRLQTNKDGRDQG